MTDNINDSVAKVVAEDGVGSWVSQVEGIVSEIASGLEEHASEKYAIREGEALFINVKALAVYAHALHQHAVFLNEQGRAEAADEATQHVIAVASLVEEAQKRTA